MLTCSIFLPAVAMGIVFDATVPRSDGSGWPWRVSNDRIGEVSEVRSTATSN